MRSVFCASLAVLALSSSFAFALPGDSAEGQRLHEANCTECHDTSVYIRRDRTVQSLDALRQQMNNCGHVTGKQFSAAQTQDLVKYLNEKFYNFR